CVLIFQCSGGSEEYADNIGKTAYDVSSGAEIGKVVAVEKENDKWMYKIVRNGQILDKPVSEIDFRDVR
ncbi:hypothetical protein KAS50_04585, partial [bacterium]|nr:hypothetical protein [bacterium]